MTDVDLDRSRILEAALGAIADAVIATNARARIVYFNAAAERMTGWRVNEAIGRPLGEIFPLRKSTVVGSLTQAALVNRESAAVEIEYHTVPLLDAAGTAGGEVFISRPRRQAAEIALQTSNESLLANADALFEEKERAQVTLNSIGDAVISTNFSGRVSYLNVVAEKMTGWTQLAASGNGVDEIFRLIDVETREMIPCPTVQAIIENRRVSLEAACLSREGNEIPVQVAAAPIHDRNGGVIGAVMVAHDVTAARELSQKLERLALHDSLTDLPNRALFVDRLSRAMTHSRSTGNYVALLYVDLDRFKQINDTLGHPVGDMLLQTVARRLLGCVRSSDTVSRQGGDEFVVLLADISRSKDAACCAEKILKALESVYRIGEFDLRITASVGIAMFPTDANDGDALLRCADAAMYQAKGRGRNNYQAFGANPIDPAA